MCYTCLKPSNAKNNYILCPLRHRINATKFESLMISHKLLLQSDPTDGNRTKYADDRVKRGSRESSVQSARRYQERRANGGYP
jgi:hypothetical protein